MSPTNFSETSLGMDGRPSATASLLLVEDEEKTATFLKRGLSESGFHVVVANDGEQGLQQAIEEHYDLMILDVGLPIMDGWSVITRLRALKHSIPVLFLTAHDGVNERVHGLDLGADDYLIKPFAFAELVARIRLVLRRNASKATVSLSAGDLMVDLIAQRAYRSGQRIDLSQTELSLLIVLMRHAPSTVSRRLLAEQVWDMHFDSNTNVVDVTVKRLRSKIDDPFPTKLIKTIRGIGYACTTE